MQNAVFDGMVRLLCPERLAMRPRHQVFGLQDIVYSTHEELLSLLDALTHEELLSLLDALEHPTPPDPNGVSASRIDPDGFPLTEEVDEDDGVEEMDETASDSHNFFPDTEIPEGLYSGHSEQDRRAANIIQRVWSKYLERKRDMMKAGHESSARRWFVVYRKALLSGMRLRTSPRYCVYFLGPLPNLQAALDSIQPALHRAKEFFKKKLVNINHQDLDEVDTTLTRIK